MLIEQGQIECPLPDLTTVGSFLFVIQPPNNLTNAVQDCGYTAFKY